METNPSCEEYDGQGIVAGTPSPTGAGWVYPALLRTGDDWLSVSETALGRGYCGTRLRSVSPDGEYTIGSPDSRGSFQGMPVDPESTVPWLTPWRINVVGDAKTIADLLAHPPVARRSGQLRCSDAVIDCAADMGWRDCLIDAFCDVQIAIELALSIVTLACLELQKAM